MSNRQRFWRNPGCGWPVAKPMQSKQKYLSLEHYDFKRVGNCFVFVILSANVGSCWSFGRQNQSTNFLALNQHVQLNITTTTNYQKTSGFKQTVFTKIANLNSNIHPDFRRFGMENPGCSEIRWFPVGQIHQVRQHLDRSFEGRTAGISYEMSIQWCLAQKLKTLKGVCLRETKQHLLWNFNRDFIDWVFCGKLVWGSQCGFSPRAQKVFHSDCSF